MIPAVRARAAPPLLGRVLMEKHQNGGLGSIMHQHYNQMQHQILIQSDHFFLTLLIGSQHCDVNARWAAQAGSSQYRQTRQAMTA
jgi:hypothetical protein